MTAIDQIIGVNITAATTAVATDSFGVPLIFGTAKTSGDASITTYQQPADLLEDGYTSSSPEYVYATAMYSQTLRPVNFRVAKRSASGAIADDLAAVDAVDPSWYCAVFPGLSDTDILAAATALEAMTKIGAFASDSANNFQQSGTDDLLSKFRSKAFDRSFLITSPAQADAGIESGIVGGQLPKDPGSSTWGYKPIKGISVDVLKPAQVAAVAGTPRTGDLGKHGNVYVNIGGVNVFFPGVMASGTFIDTRIGVDSLTSVAKTNIMQLLIDQEKIPYTEAGCVQIESAIRAAINTHVGYGFLDSDPATIKVDHTPVHLVSATQRAQRLAPPFTFTCRTTGAMQGFVIQGTVNV